jgi:hypothetical protein
LDDLNKSSLVAARAKSTRNHQMILTVPFRNLQACHYN